MPRSGSSNAVTVVGIDALCSGAGPCPEYCGTIRKRFGKGACEGVPGVVKEFMAAMKEAGWSAIVLCCRWGLKLLVISTDKDIFAAYTRSPIPDWDNVKGVAEKLGEDNETVQALLAEVPKFGPDFVKEVLLRLRATGVGPLDGAAADAERVGESYRMFAVDIVTFRSLHGLDPKGSLAGVFVKMRSPGQESANGPVMRLVNHVISSNEEQTEVAAPIIGLAVPTGEAAKAETEVKLADPIKLLKDLVFGKHKLRPVGALGRPKGRNLTDDELVWEADVQIFGNEEDLSVEQDFQRRVEACLHIGAATAPQWLLEPLVTMKEDDGNWRGSWREFRGRLEQAASLDIHPTDWHGRRTLWRIVLRDLKAVVAALPEREVEERRRPIARQAARVLRSLDLYSAIGRAELSFQAVDGDRQRLLKEDLRSDGDQYVDMMKRHNVHLMLAKLKYTPDSVRKAMALNRDYAKEALVTAYETDRLSLGSDRGNAAWQAISGALGREERTELARRLLARREPWRTSVSTAMHAILAAGAFTMTVGSVSAIPVMASLERKYFDRRIRNLLAPAGPSHDELLQTGGGTTTREQ